MVSAVRLAVVGVGRMGSFHARELATVDQVDVAAVVDPDRDRAASVADAVSAIALGSPDELLESEEVEAWLIATPTPTHLELVAMALDAGLPVLCEKPLSLDPDSSLMLGSQARASSLVLQVGFWRRFSPPWSAAKQLIEAGAIGRPLSLRLTQWDANPPPAEFCDPAVSGGLAIDCGVHEYDLAEWLTGLPVESVVATNLPIVEPSVGDAGDVDNLVATLGMIGGAGATVDLSRNCRYGDDVRTEILGEQGAIFIDMLPRGRTRVATSAGFEVVAGSEALDAAAFGVRRQAELFARAIRGEEVDLPGAEASARALMVGRAVQEAAITGDRIALPR